MGVMGKKYYSYPDYMVGYTASKKVGNAVRRNLAKRRMRELARLLMPRHARHGWNYVMVARRDTPYADWSVLKSELIRMINSLHWRFDR